MLVILLPEWTTPTVLCASNSSLLPTPRFELHLWLDVQPESQQFVGRGPKDSSCAGGWMDKAFVSVNVKLYVSIRLAVGSMDTDATGSDCNGVWMDVAWLPKLQPAQPSCDLTCDLAVRTSSGSKQETAGFKDTSRSRGGILGVEERLSHGGED